MTKHKAADMKQLVCVEYSPNQVKRGSDLLGRDATNKTPLFGAVGETRRDMLLAALQKIKKTEQSKISVPSSLIPVRFPLVCPNSNLKFWDKGRDPSDPRCLEEEGIMLSPYDLHLLRRKPVSAYQARALKDPGQLENLLEKDYFHQTYSLDAFLGAVDSLGSVFPYVWNWKREMLKPEGKQEAVFYGARFYGADTVISMYDNSSFKGVALEVASRPWPTAQQYKEGTRLLRIRTDVFLLTNTEEYVSHIDGVDLKRQKLKASNLITNYRNLVQPAQAASVEKILAAEAAKIKDETVKKTDTAAVNVGAKNVAKANK